MLGLDAASRRKPSRCPGIYGFVTLLLLFAPRRRSSPRPAEIQIRGWRRARKQGGRVAAAAGGCGDRHRLGRADGARRRGGLVHFHPGAGRIALVPGARSAAASPRVFRRGDAHRRARFPGAAGSPRRPHPWATPLFSQGLSRSCWVPSSARPMTGSSPPRRGLPPLPRPARRCLPPPPSWTSRSCRPISPAPSRARFYFWQGVTALVALWLLVRLHAARKSIARRAEKAELDLG